jgi:D-glycero-D-manno-heptose 1,7-bisphosphate phosphatase
VDSTRAGQAFKLYVFDADGTLRRSTVPGKPCPNSNDEWELIPGVRERLAGIEWGPEGARFGVASNQGGVGLGYLTLRTARSMLEEMVSQAFGVRPPPPGSVEICPHAPHLKCPCRKPKPEMLRRLMRRFRAAPVETIFVGDMPTDEETALNAGTHFAWAHEFFGWPRPEG